MRRRDAVNNEKYIFSDRNSAHSPPPFFLFFVSVPSMLSAFKQLQCVFLLILTVMCGGIVSPAIESTSSSSSSSSASVNDREIHPAAPVLPPASLNSPQSPNQSIEEPKSIVITLPSYDSCSRLVCGVDLSDEKFQQLAKKIKSYVCQKASHLDKTILECIENGNAQGLSQLSKCSICLSRIPSSKMVGKSTP